jgi:hypothetical protein
MHYQQFVIVSSSIPVPLRTMLQPRKESCCALSKGAKHQPKEEKGLYSRVFTRRREDEQNPSLEQLPELGSRRLPF